MNIIERSELIYNTMDEGMFWKLLQSKSDELSNDSIEISGYCSNGNGLPIWKTAYPMIKIGGKEFELKDGNTFSNDEWIDDTPEIKRKLDVMNDDLFQKNMKVKLKGLQSKPNWNGISGIIADKYNFKKERWLVKIDKPVNRTVLIKTSELV